jgi:hypothetical protein
LGELRVRQVELERPVTPLLLEVAHDRGVEG